MRTRSFAFLAALCCTVLSGVAGVSQSVEVGESAELARRGGRDINLGLATNQLMLLDGSTAALSISESGQRRDLNGDGDMEDEVAHVFDAASGEVRNLGLSINPDSPLLQDGLFAFAAREDLGDLNGDGDTSDSVLHVYDTARRSLSNLRLAAVTDMRFDGRRLVFGVGETQQGQRDLNRDGDTADSVLHVFDRVTGRTQNTALAVFAVDPLAVVLGDRWIAVVVGEAESGFQSTQGQVDLNGDGDVIDIVAYLYDTGTRRAVNPRLAAQVTDFSNVILGTDVALVPVAEGNQGADLNADQDLNDVVLQVVDLASGRIRNTARALFRDALFAFDLEQSRVTFTVQESAQGNTDLNGDGDTDDFVLHMLSTRSGQIRNLRVEGLADLGADGRAVLLVPEFPDGRDLNGDGDREDVVVGLADLSREVPRVVNTGRAIAFFGRDPPFFPQLDILAFQKSGNLFSFLVFEGDGNRDLNADGDTDDFVLHISDLSTFTTRNSGIEGSFASRSVLAALLPPSDGRVAVPMRESDQGGRDLNRDGDADDMVLQIFDSRSGRAGNTGLAVASEKDFVFEVPLLIRGESFVSVVVPEGSVDLNSDGDTADRVLHILDVGTGKITNVRRAIGTNLNRPFGDFDFDFAGFTGAKPFSQEFLFRATTVGDAPDAGPGIGDAYTFVVSEAAQGNVDLNGDGDTDDTVVHATRLTDRDRDGRFDFAEAGTPRSP